MPSLRRYQKRLKELCMAKIRRFPRSAPDSSIFHTRKEFKNAGPITFAINGFLQNEAATLIGGLSGHGKTLILLSLVRTLFSQPGTKLWGEFEVLEPASRVIYLIPESGLTPFKHRIKLFGLSDLVGRRLLIHTLTKGVTPQLDDPKLLKEVKHAHIFLDTAIRFGDGEENLASANQQGLAAKIFRLLAEGARSVVGAHHSPKSFATQNAMTLENILRGSGDIGAMVATAWGVRQIDRDRTIVHIENIKARDFQSCGPFQIIGRPYIDKQGDFHMLKKPGACGSLSDELAANKDKGGRKKDPDKKRNLELLKKWDSQRKRTSAQIVKKFAKAGITVTSNTVRGYRKQLRDSPVSKTSPENPS
jgi:hypothetical protein